jgi:hypothetical protein
MYNVVLGSKYTTNGEERTRWTKVGEAYKKDKGMTLRLDVAILSKPGETTWFNLFEKEQVADGVQKKNE